MTVAEYAQNIGEVWNLGLAGALDGGLPLGEIVEIKSVGKYISSGTLDPLSQECVRSAIPHLDLDLGFPYNGGESLPFSLSAPGGRLISSDFPIHDAQHREYLSKTWDLVDMEGYGIAYAACYLGKKCRMWKIVSDFASPGGRELIRKNKARLSERIAEKIYEAIHESSPDP